MSFFLYWYLSLAALNVDLDIVSNFLIMLQHFLITLLLHMLFLTLKIHQYDVLHFSCSDGVLIA